MKVKRIYSASYLWVSLKLQYRRTNISFYFSVRILHIIGAKECQHVLDVSRLGNYMTKR